VSGRVRRDERGLVLPTRLMVFSVSLVALAGLAFIATQPADSPDEASPAASTHSRPTSTPTGLPSTLPVAPSTTTARTARPEVRRARYYVVVFNNSNVQGLAGKTGDRVQRAGWNLVGTDNWYGTIDATTVYFPAGMKAAAGLLADDLGINRLRPSIPPMRSDRLTVILTADYTG
jgi:hypothetical protein